MLSIPSIPKWLSNSLAVSEPYLTLERKRKNVTKTSLQPPSVADEAWLIFECWILPWCNDLVLCQQPMPRCLHWNLLLNAFKAEMHGYKNAPVFRWWVNILPTAMFSILISHALVASYPARSLNKQPGYEALQTAVFMNTVHSGNNLEWVFTFAKFRGSLISRISQIYNRSRKYFNKNFWHTAYRCVCRKLFQWNFQKSLFAKI